VRRVVFNASSVFQQSVGGSGPVHPDEDLRGRGAGDLGEGVGEHMDVVGHRVVG
jgi:hypothetical protein